MKNDIYLDSNATTTVLPSAVDAIVRSMVETYGNPSSAHSLGLRARALLNEVRDRASRLLGVGSGRIMFNSGATEGIQTAVLSALSSVAQRRDSGEAVGSLLLYGATEHKAVPESLAHWNRILGLHLEIRPIPVDHEGRHELDTLAQLAPDAALVCTMAANNETGVISDIEGIGEVLENSSALWLVDCVQALGKLPIDLARTRIDYAPFSGHKLYAPKGVGMLYVRDGAPFTPLMMGGGQESGWRSGTENMAGISALGAVLEELESGTVFRSPAELAEFRNLLVAALSSSFRGIVFNTPLDKSLGTTLNFSVPGLSSGQVLDLFDAAGVYVSAGSACSAAKGAASYVLVAMGLPAWQCENAVRMSFGPAVDLATIMEASKRIIRCGDVLRELGMVEDRSAQRIDGIKVISAGARHTWLLLDADTGSAIGFDVHPELRSQVQAFLERHRHSMVTELSTTNSSWPLESDTMFLGQWRVKRIHAGHEAITYIVAGKDGSDVFALIGRQRADALQAVIPPHVFLCDANGEINATIPSTTDAPGSDSTDMHLSADRLQALMRKCPETLLIDVREPPEFLASVREGLLARAVNIPSSQLVNSLHSWLAHRNTSPIVFLCRSGNRSDRAARCLRRLGHKEAYHIAGGLAMEGEALRSGS